MKNAHERLGKLLYRRQTEKTATNLRVFLDALWEWEKAKPIWSQWLAVTWKSAHWPPHLRTEIYSQ